MSEPTAERLYALLPGVYRQRDAACGQPLRALMAVLESELAQLEDETAALYDDWFIETCRPAVVPRIGELLGVTGREGMLDDDLDLRGLVAGILSLRQRKGTASALEEVASEITGWVARLVEYAPLIATTQDLQHPRPDHGKTFDLRDSSALARVGTPFESLPRSVEIGRIATDLGRYNVNNVALFLWRARSHRVERVPARAVAGSGGGCFVAHPLGYDTPLCNQPQPRIDLTGRIAPVHVPGPISRAALSVDLQGFRGRWADVEPGARPQASRYCGPGRGVEIYRDGVCVSPVEIVCCDLSTWTRPEGDGVIALDPELGRLALPVSQAGVELSLSYTTNFSADLGGGGYDRRETISASSGEDVRGGGQGLAERLGAGLGVGSTRLQIVDSQAYVGPRELALVAGGQLTIEAAAGERPSLHLGEGLEILAPRGRARLTLSGLWIEGGLSVRVPEGGGGELHIELRHCTLVPGASEGQGGHVAADVVAVSGGEGLALTLSLDHCISGALRLPAGATLVVRDSIVDGGSDGGLRHAIAGPGESLGPACTIERSTILGGTRVATAPELRDALLCGPIEVDRRVEDLTGPTPKFIDLRYGQPGYAALRDDCDPAITTGAEDGSELGVFAHLHRPHRRARLDEILDEHMPFGLDVGVFFVT